jgi:TonB family protein
MVSRVAAGVVITGLMLAIMSGYAVARPFAQGQSQEEDFLKGAYTSDTPGITLPTVKKMVYPKYTSDAMRAKIQGQVEVQAVVLPDGTVGRARVLTSLDKRLGLDDQALAAAKQCTFVPGKLNGQSVAIAVTLKLEFRLH